jgi:uncharacterized membrane protein (DUF4010 family)
MEPAEAFPRLGLALALGLLVGLQRERVRSKLAGIRTFALITLLGALLGLLSASLGGAVVGWGAAAAAILLVIGNIQKLSKGDAEPGLTTEFAALAMYGVGVCTAIGSPAVAVALSGAIALLLHLKRPLHEFVGRIGEQDVRAIMQFVLIALVILPVLPDRDYGPFAVWNPRNIWLMVVLIVGMSLAGYVAFKLVGQRAGVVLTGLLGGVISSTATTVSYARRSREATLSASSAAAVIVLASSVAFVRVLLELAVVAAPWLPVMAPPLAAMLAVMTVASLACVCLARDGAPEAQAPDNPAELRTALTFGAGYAMILLAVAATTHYVGNDGLYLVAAVSGLTDMDAITLSTGRLVQQGRLPAETGWRLVLVAALANLVFKGLLVFGLGPRRLALRFGIVLCAAMASGLTLLVAWPWMGR